MVYSKAYKIKKKSARFKINLLPGPVHIQDKVKKHFGRVPISHRADNFINELNHVKDMFRHITLCKNVEIGLGSGTFANDLVAGQLSIINKPGLILSNGEFGTRLIDHAKRFNLTFESVKSSWGKEFNYKKIEQKILSGRIHWIWFVHHETSTGMINDFSLLQKLAKKNNVLFCVDCISSICAVPLDLSKADFASGTSGKAIGSYPGLSFIFYRKAYTSKKISVPRYLDLNIYRKNNGIPFTSSSNLLSALSNALKYFIDDSNRFKKISMQTKWMVDQLNDIDIPVLVTGKYASPIITTVILTKKVSSKLIGEHLKSLGYHVHYKRSYLQENNWIQISSMSVYSKKHLKPMFDILKKAVKRKK